MDEVESLSHTKWDCKYHVGLHSQVSQEDAVRGAAAASWGGVPETGDAEGKPD